MTVFEHDGGWFRAWFESQGKAEEDGLGAKYSAAECRCVLQDAGPVSLRSRCGGGVVAGQFDCVVSVVNEVNLPGKVVQYIHCPIRSATVVAQLYSGPQRWLRLLNTLVCDQLSGGRMRFAGDGCVYITNSNWTAELFERAYGVRPQVVYPPVHLPTPDAPVPYTERELGVVSIGRFEREKRLEEAIAVVDRLRSIQPRLTLHIVGGGSGAYRGKLLKLIAGRPYVSLHENVSKPQLAELLHRNRFGLHFRRNEHFGIAVAEMVAAGLVTFVHNSGGAPEVVGHRPELLFNSLSELAAKMQAILRDEALAVSLHTELQQSARRFSVTEFKNRILSVLSTVIGDHGGDTRG